MPSRDPLAPLNSLNAVQSGEPLFVHQTNFFIFDFFFPPFDSIPRFFIFERFLFPGTDAKERRWSGRARFNSMETARFGKLVSRCESLEEVVI